MNQMFKHRFLWDLKVSLQFLEHVILAGGTWSEETQHCIMGHFCPAGVGSLSVWNVCDGPLLLLLGT